MSGCLLSEVRSGPRPRTRRALPHLQLDQWPPPEIALDLLERALRLPYIRARESRMAAPSSVALTLPDNLAGGPPEAFIDQHEFCLIHALPEGSIHATLPGSLPEQVARLGWGEPHPATREGIMPPTLVMLYAPRTLLELEIAFGLIQISWQFAAGAGARIPPTLVFTEAV